MSKHRLIVEEDYDFLCYGLSCHIKDYRVAWHLNQSLKFNFRRSQVEIRDRSGETFEYATFVHRDPKSHIRYILINNFSGNQPLIKAYKQFNMLMVVEGYIDIFDGEGFIGNLHAQESVQLVTALPTSPLEKIQFALFEE
jgi:hypothetical protein